MNFYVKILIGLSVVVNLILIGYVVGYWPLFFVVSALLNLAFGLYVRKLVKTQNELVEAHDDVWGHVDGLRERLESIDRMDVFMGDPTIQAMITHARSVANSLAEFQVKFSSQRIEVIDEEGEEIGEENEE